MLHRSEWLADAERVPVGQHRRVYHGAERRPNLVVYNNTDSWSCYCHACHDGNKVYKQVLQKAVEVPTVMRKYLSTTDCCTLPELAQKHPDKFKRLVVLLHRKRMSTALLTPYEPLYNLTDDRLVLGFNGAYVGRDCTERSHSKWFHYYTVTPLDYVYLQGSFTLGTREPVVLTEDLFSAIKVKHYTGLSTLCCLGTHVSDSIVGFLTYPRADKVMYPVLAFDGDAAGDTAKKVASTRLQIRGVPFTSVRVPDGNDPKDLSPSELQELFKGVRNEY